MRQRTELIYGERENSHSEVNRIIELKKPLKYNAATIRKNQMFSIFMQYSWMGWYSQHIIERYVHDALTRFCVKSIIFSYFLLLLSTAICVLLLLRCEIISYSSCNIDVTKWPSHSFPEMCLQIKNINFSHRRTIELDFLEREKKRTNQHKKYACEISNLINHLRQFFYG